ncbi:MAG: pentapeptide repeat-containing protein, partial [Cyanobacteriota bacterium]|nr:pentapeptide repeat-containing protein [Cyanobacteriota bacterium]
MSNNFDFAQKRKFSQNTLTLNFQGFIGGQTQTAKQFLLTFIVLLTSLSGALAGFWGTWMSLYILFPDYIEQRIVGSFVFGVSTIFIVETLRRGLSKGLPRIALTLIGAIALSVGAIGYFDLDLGVLVAIIVFTAISLSAILFCILFGSLSSSLILILLPKKQGFVKKIYLGWMIATSVFSGYFTIDSLREISSISDRITVVGLAITSGLFFGSGATAIDFWVTNLKAPTARNFKFLKDWAIALGCWGGTSFYNLDLSNVNFRGAKLANTDLRAQKLYRTCFQEVTGLERARVDNRYLDLDCPKVQELLTRATSEDRDFSRLNLRGAYLRGAHLRHFNFTDAELAGADLQGADLRGSLFVRTQAIGVDLTRANLTGICIKDWSVNSQTDFTEVECDYIYREIDDTGEPSDRFPANRNFEHREFESLYQEVENVVELIFQEGENWQAALFGLRKLQIEDEGLELELKGIERRGDLWVVKVTHNRVFPKQEVEQRLNGSFDEMKKQLAAKEGQINRLLGIVADQAEALKGYSKQPFGNHFLIVGSTITNLSGSGQIDYDEAAHQVRSVVANRGDPDRAIALSSELLTSLQEQRVTATVEEQVELIEQVILTEAEKDPFFRQFLMQTEDQRGESAIATALKQAIARLN